MVRKIIIYTAFVSLACICRYARYFDRAAEKRLNCNCVPHVGSLFLEPCSAYKTEDLSDFKNMPGLKSAFKAMPFAHTSLALLRHKKALTHTSLALLRHKKAPAHTGIETKDLSGSQSMSGLESGFTTIQCAYRG